MSPFLFEMGSGRNYQPLLLPTALSLLQYSNLDDQQLRAAHRKECHVRSWNNISILGSLLCDGVHTYQPLVLFGSSWHRRPLVQRNYQMLQADNSLTAALSLFDRTTILSTTSARGMYYLHGNITRPGK